MDILGMKVVHDPAVPADELWIVPSLAGQRFETVQARVSWILQHGVRLINVGGLTEGTDTAQK